MALTVLNTDILYTRIAAALAERLDDGTTNSVTLHRPEKDGAIESVRVYAGEDGRIADLGEAAKVADYFGCALAAHAGNAESGMFIEISEWN